MGITAATLTAFYMARCYILTFWGDFRGWAIGRPSQVSASEDDDAEGDHDADHHDHHEEDLTVPGPAPHESPRPMTIPLLILATASIVAGALLNPVAFRLLAHDFDWLPMEHWLSPVFADASAGVGSAASDEH